MQPFPKSLGKPIGRVKKSETLEIRLPHPTKLAFMAACRDEGRSASEALRQFIETHLEAPPPRRGRRGGHLVAGALIVAALGAVALPSLARPDVRAAFARLGLDGDRHAGCVAPADEHPATRSAAGTARRPD
ncbi:hypothetical protein [Phenylobacterium sp.]|uniref:hypothetical protein n=1 Tax=Phenylobacterium sp. TaxID=1871053 RepID=UPI00286CB5FA|nr:hypothetical protein [Phenylobacterium sp.]